MRLIFLLVPLLQVALAEDVSGYLGETVTLPSGVDPSWNLSKIEWSVFSNNSWIATYRKGAVNVERAPQYKGRLSLNKASGDLTIHYLSQNDDMEYKVELVNVEERTESNKIRLTVKKHLQKPNIQTQLWVPSTSTTGGRWVEAHCSSPDKNVTFSWEIEPPGVTLTKTLDGHTDVVLAFLNKTQNSVKFTCISKSKTEQASSAVTKQWEDAKPHPSPQPQPPSQLQPRSRHALLFFGGVLVGFTVTVFMMVIFGEKCKIAWEAVKGKFCTQ